MGTNGLEVTTAMPSAGIIGRLSGSPKRGSREGRGGTPGPYTWPATSAVLGGCETSGRPRGLGGNPRWVAYVHVVFVDGHSETGGKCSRLAQSSIYLGTPKTGE